MAPGPMRLKRALPISEQRSTNECLGWKLTWCALPTRMITFSSLRSRDLTCSVHSRRAFDLQGWHMLEPPLQSPELALQPRSLHFIKSQYLCQYLAWMSSGWPVLLQGYECSSHDRASPQAVRYIRPGSVWCTTPHGKQTSTTHRRFPCSPIC